MQDLTPKLYVYDPPGSNWLYQRGSDTRYKTASGNTAAISGEASFTCDGYNRLATSTTAAEVTTYTYNSFGERIKKANQNGLSTVFHYGPNGELLFEKDQSGNTREYVWLHGRPLARIDNGTSIHYYHVDHLGTPQAMTDASGATVWKADYEPFGKATVKVGKVENNLRFPGQYYDRETGLHYNYFRDYDPSTGRYPQADPIGLAGGLNVYVYGLNNPLTYTDPLGLAPWDWDGWGDTSACSYYDKMFTKTKCDYYKTAGNICRGNRGDVNLLTRLGVSQAWASGTTTKSQSQIANGIRNSLIGYDRAMHSLNDSGDACGCPRGDFIDLYHDMAFRENGISPLFYGGNLWPQSVPPNPVPYDPR